MMDVTPGPDSLALTPMLVAAELPHRSVRMDIVQSRWSRAALVALVFVLGLLQGTRAALGDMPLRELPVAAEAQAPVPGVSEPDALRGHFFRPAGSDAVRPVLRLHQSRWNPGEAKRLAFFCDDAAC
jgi:hypothetical protein